MNQKHGQVSYENVSHSILRKWLIHPHVSSFLRKHNIRWSLRSTLYIKAVIYNREHNKPFQTKWKYASWNRVISQQCLLNMSGSLAVLNELSYRIMQIKAFSQVVPQNQVHSWQTEVLPFGSVSIPSPLHVNIKPLKRLRYSC